MYSDTISWGSPGAAVILAAMLKKNTSVKGIKITKLDMGEAGRIAFGDMLKCNTTIVSMWICGFISDREDGMVSFVGGLAENTSITDISFVKCKIGDEAMDAFAMVLKVNSTLESLQIHDCFIGYLGADDLDIGDALKHNTSLKKLILSKCDIGVKGAKALARGLKDSSSLVELSMACNCIEDDGAEWLSGVFGQNTSLSTLCLSNCSIGPDGVIDILRELGEFTALKVLDISNNDIGKGIDKMYDMLVDNSLEELIIGNCGLKEEGYVLLGSALEMNHSLTTLDVGWPRLQGDSNDAFMEAFMKMLRVNTTLKDMGESMTNNKVGALLRRNRGLDVGRRLKAARTQ